MLYSCSAHEQTRLSSYEPQSQSLISGAIEDHWSSLPGQQVTWKVTDGMLHPDVSIDTSTANDLVSNEVFGNFILTFEFNFTKGANSGIKYLIQDEHGNVGLEYQIVDDINNADNQKPKNQTAALYDILPPRGKSLNGFNKINKGRIVFRDGKGEHWLNGKKVLEYDLASTRFRDAVATSKFRSFDWFGTFRSGRILLQHHGDLVYFKKINIVKL